MHDIEMWIMGLVFGMLLAILVRELGVYVRSAKRNRPDPLEMDVDDTPQDHRWQK